MPDEASSAPGPRRRHRRSHRARRRRPDSFKSLLTGFSRWLVIGAVALSPWLFGAAETWAYLLVCILVSLAVLLWLLSGACLAPGRRCDSPLLWAAVAFAGFLVLQSVCLPRSVVRVASPFTAGFQSQRDEVLGATGLSDAAERTCAGFTLSVSAAQTAGDLQVLAACIGIVLVLSNSFHHWGELRRAAGVLAASGFALALFGMMQAFAGAEAIYGFYSPALGGTFFGPFSNRNHFAAHMNLLLAVALGLALSGGDAPGLVRSKTWRERAAWLASREGSATLLAGFAAAIMAVSVCFSLSRGGAISLLFAAGVVGAVGRRGPAGSRRSARWTAVVALAAVAVLAWLGWDAVARRLGTLAVIARDPVGNSRTQATLGTLRLFLECPLFGCGYGAFRHVFPLFQAPGLQNWRWLHAHNDWAEALAEGGVAGAALLVTVFVTGCRVLRSRCAGASHERLFFVRGLMVGVAAIAVHSLIDFSLHRPANAFALSALIGLAMAALGSSQGLMSAERAGYWSLLWKRAFVAVVGIGALALAVQAAGGLRGEVAYARFRQWMRLATPDAAPEKRSLAVAEASLDAERIMGRARRNPDTLLDVAIGLGRCLANERLSPELRVEMAKQAERAAVLAVIAGPSNYEYWLWLARVEHMLGREAASGACLARAQELAPPGKMLRLSGRGET